ncbi:hypothetical protein M9Y10_013790 [Tritrichomonas musculus]|uniref:Uncharacterized protein n=1 Tax=Tritrichomonas musculus TaxID=1915356 RepID=A0ABR2KXS3_9EUKA
MTKAGEYLKGTKRLQIINKWLRGIEDPIYEVYPTRIKDKVKDIDYNKEDEKEEEDNDEEQEDDEKEEDHEEQDKLDEDNNEPDEKSDEEPVPLFNQQFNPKYNHFKYDLTYINMQILYELQQINEFLKKDRERKEHKKMTKDIINKVMNEKNKNDDIEVVYYEQPPKMKRRNNVFADVGF